MRNLFLVFILFLHADCIGQAGNLRPEIRKLVDDIAADNVLKSSGVGVVGARTPQWERFEKLGQDASNAELIALTDHKNAVVRCYAFDALVMRKNINLFPVVVKHLTDTAILETFSGCIMSSECAGDHFLRVVEPEFHYPNVSTLSRAELAAADSIMIFDKRIHLYAKDMLLWKLKPKKIYYARVKEIFREEGNCNAIVALSKFKNPADRRLITALLQSRKQYGAEAVKYYGLAAVRNFPDAAFFTYVRAIHAEETARTTGFDPSLIRMLYQAIVQYKDAPSKKMLETALHNAKGHALGVHTDNIWVALKKYPAPVYKDIMSRIKLSDTDQRDMLYVVNSDY